MENMEPNTPYYIYDADRFADDIALVKKALGNIPLTYSIKANPVMTGYITGDIRYVEVCSPGELKICKADQIDPDRILYSGVVKGEADVGEAIDYGIRLFTAESPTQFDLVSDLAERMGEDIDILLRLSGGNQFGMSSEAIEQIVSRRSEIVNVTIKGLHFYGGTQKKDVSQIEEDLENLYSMTRKLKEDYDFEVSLVEYGPGLFVDYFGDITADSTVSELKMILDT